MSRTPNPFNERAALVAEALEWAAREGKIADLSTATYKELRPVLKELGLYTSEGSFRRDIAAIRKTLPEFGGPRAGPSGSASIGKTIELADDARFRAIRVDDLTPALLRRVVGVAAGRLDRPTVRWLDPAMLPAASLAEVRAQLLTLAPRPRGRGDRYGGSSRDGRNTTPCAWDGPDCTVQPGPLCLNCAIDLVQRYERDELIAQQFDKLGLRDEQRIEAWLMIDMAREEIEAERSWGGDVWVFIR